MDSHIVLSEEEVQVMIHRHRLAEVITTAGKQLAIRATALGILIDRVASLWQDADPAGVMSRLVEIELAPEQTDDLAAAIVRLAADADSLPSRQRARIDGFLKQLVFVLPQARAERFVLEALTHRRQSRRHVAYKWLRRNPRATDLVLTLLNVHLQTGDQEPLILIAREESAVGSADVDILLRGLAERYWRARVIASLLVLDREKAISLASAYPVEFVHAVGRRQDSALQVEIDSLYEKQKTNAEFLCLYVWALGKLRSDARLAEVLEALRPLYGYDPSANEGIQPSGSERNGAGGCSGRVSPPAADTWR